MHKPESVRETRKILLGFEIQMDYLIPARKRKKKEKEKKREAAI